MDSKIAQVFGLQLEHKYIQKNTLGNYRVDKLKKLKKVISNKRDLICQALRDDFNKAEMESDLTEILPVYSLLNDHIKNLKIWMKPQTVKSPFYFFGTKHEISYEGKGNVLVLAPWNYPFLLALGPIITAFSAGNTTILKPSEFTPNINKIIGDIIKDTFTDEEVYMFEGEVEVASQLLELPFNHIFFTGSTPVGKIIMRKAADHLASVSLELGGKSPVIVDKSANLEVAAKRIIWGKLTNAGQTCVAPDYVLVDAENIDALIEYMKNEILTKYNINSKKINKDYPAIINKKNMLRLISMTEDAKSKGGEVAYQGTHDLERCIFAPTILRNVTDDMQVLQEEIFGPILPIVLKDDLNSMLSYINKRDNPLSLYIFSKDSKVAKRVQKNTSSGGYTINDTLMQVAHPKLPFGGAGTSGIGKYHGHFGFEELSNIRSISERTRYTALSYFAPPYNFMKRKLVTRLFKWFNRYL